MAAAAAAAAAASDPMSSKDAEDFADAEPQWPCKHLHRRHLGSAERLALEGAPQNGEAWQRGRDGVWGASAAAKLCRWCPYVRRVDYLLMAAGRLPPPPPIGTDPERDFCTQHGHRYEAEAVHFYQLLCGVERPCRCQEPEVRIRETGLHIHPRHAFIGASPDRLRHSSCRCSGVVEVAPVEAKCPIYGLPVPRAASRGGGLGRGDSAVWRHTRVPVHWWLQGVQQCAVLGGAPYFDLVMYWRENDRQPARLAPRPERGWVVGELVVVRVWRNKTLERNLERELVRSAMDLRRLEGGAPGLVEASLALERHPDLDEGVATLMTPMQRVRLLRSTLEVPAGTDGAEQLQYDDFDVLEPEPEHSWTLRQMHALG